MPLQFANAAFTTLSSGVNNSTTTIPVTANTAVGFPASAPYICRIKAETSNTDEIVLVTAGAGTNSWTVTRAYESYHGSSSASAHSSGATIELIFSGATLSQSQGYALDMYIIDPTYGDHFTGSSLSGIWTRRNVPSSETFQIGPKGTYMRSVFSSLTHGDGYYQTAPSGDWTFAAAFVNRPGAMGFGVGVVDSSGTGVHASFYNSPDALLVSDVTTYTTYGGTFDQTIDFLSNTNPGTYQTPRKVWIYLRKSSTSYFGAYSFDGEVWSDESPAHTWSGTVDRVALSMSALVSCGANEFHDIDWFNKIA